MAVPPKPPIPSMLVLYGSQTGVAQSLAERIVMQARNLFPSQLSINLSSMDSYTPVSRLVKEQSTLLFICSTTGYGVPPDNMHQFWKRIMHRSLPIGRALTANHRFLVLGLGDSSYPKFNVVAKKLYRRLLQLGANALPLHQNESAKSNDPGLGLADEQAEFGVHSLLLWWLPTMWNLLSQYWGVEFRPGVPIPPNFQFLESPSFINDTWPKYTVDSCQSFNQNVPSPVLDHHHMASNKDDDVDLPALLPSTEIFRVLANQRLTTLDHFQDTRLITLSGKNNQHQFNPSDVFFVCPQNHPADVCKLFDLTGADPSQRMIVQSRDRNFPLVLSSSGDSQSIEVSLLHLATYYFDLNSIPSLFFFSNLATVAYRALLPSGQVRNTQRLQLEFDRLVELSSFSDSDMVEELFDYVHRPRRTVLEVLIDFPTTSQHLDPQMLFDVLPGPIRPRPYSIASAPSELQILVAVISFPTQMSTLRRGLTSSYLASLKEGDSVRGWTSSNVTGGFNFAPLLNSPASPSQCILVATGTGIAPFRSFLQHQFRLFPKDTRHNMLFFGCRYCDKDFYFAQEWENLKSAHHLELVPAFSRQTSSHRDYVQDRLISNADKVWMLLSDPKTFVLICGNAKAMPNQVLQALQTIMQKAGQLSLSESERYLIEMEENGRLQVEAWS